MASTSSLRASASNSSISSTSSASSPSPSRPRAGDAEELHAHPQDEEEYAPSPTLLAAYDTLMASRFPNLALPSPSTSAPGAIPVPTADDDEPEDPDRPLTKAERQNAKKKRRKERERALKAAAAAAKGEVAASQAPEKAEEGPVLSLSTAEVYALTPNPRLRPLPVDVQERIRRLAAEAAVDSPSFDPISAEPDAQLWRADGGMTPPAFLAYTTEVEHKCIAVPAVHLRRCGGERAEEEDVKDEMREERRAKRRRAFPPAQFWTPPAGVVARGYGYGWSL